ncbi:hypothetical protein RND71_005217 [Anisodus tanguticus]|uniref:Uncharacterized protein n=1 Tax=Anisodus tanguticus TaxID=243964 RepID=A0AAE1SRL4_9SOLA|nr:hypothetical protein RND71_005217 [Anisodus tanguticus]
MIVTNDDPYITFKHYTDVADGEVSHKNGNVNDVHAAHTVHGAEVDNGILHGAEVDNGILHGVVVDDGILHAKEEDTLSDVIVGVCNKTLENWLRGSENILTLEEKLVGIDIIRMTTNEDPNEIFEHYIEVSNNGHTNGVVADEEEALSNVAIGDGDDVANLTDVVDQCSTKMGSRK